MNRGASPTRNRWWWLLALLGCSLPAQLRGPATASVGGTITIEVGTNDGTVQVCPRNSNRTASHHVPGNKRVVVPVPNVPPGTLLVVSVGSGDRAYCILIEVVAP